MSGDVALDSGQLDSSLSVLSSPSQASDASSAAANRVFFGPVRSPEKKFARRAGSVPFRTPVRRSARLSSTMVPLPLFSRSQSPALAGIASDSRDGTPDEDGIADEPSVVLASRVLSASGNPSPPPTPPLQPQSESEGFMDVQLLDTTDSPQPASASISARSGPLIPIEDISEPAAASSSLAPRISTPTPPGFDFANTSQPDLITFDSFSAQEDDSQARMESQEQATLSVKPPNATVDDLLSMSPHPQPNSAPEAQNTDALPSANDVRDDATNPDDEMEVANSLVIEADSPTLPPPNDRCAEPEEAENAERTESSEQVAENVPDSSPPLRRSSRPRRSRSSLPQTITNPQQPTHLSTGNTEDAEKGIDVQALPESQPSPLRKRKLKAFPQPVDNGAGSSTDTHTPRKLPQIVLARRELGSLSPLSAAVLTQLLPKATGDSASRSTTPQPQESLVPVPPEPAPGPSTPPPQTTDFVFPKVGPHVDGTAPETQRARSPLRPFPTSPSKLDDVTRTPARRVPIAQAIVEGTYSAQKLPALFSATRPAAAPGTPGFRRLALDDPTRSPAKRIPMSEAVPVPPPSPDKGKSVAHLSSPIRPLARERQRSGSAEPRPQLGRKERGASAEPTTRPPALGRRPVFQKPASSEGVPSSSGLVKPRTALPYPLVRSQRLHPAIPESDEPGPSAVRRLEAIAVDANPQPSDGPPKAPSHLRQPTAGPGSRIPRIGAKPYARPKVVGKAESTQSKLPTPAKNKLASKPLRVVTVGSSSSGGSSDEGHGAAPLVPRPVRRQATAAPSSEAASAHGLKRKREPEVSKAAAPAAQPVIVMRKVVPGMFNKGEKAGPAAATTSTAASAERTQPKASAAVPSPAKPSGPIRARSAVNWKRPQTESEPPPQPSPTLETPQAQEVARVLTPEPTHAPAAATAPVSVPAPAHAPLPASAPAAPDVQAGTSPAKDKREPTPPLPPLAPPPATSSSVPSDATIDGPSTTPDSVEEKPGRQRRSTRSKRAQERPTAGDVFGPTQAPAPLSSSSGSTRPLHIRRKPGPFPSETAGPFAGMSALALKTLTNANTLKNQQQLAVFQTEVVRKEGPRPDSPTTKVRSALERQWEERAQQRKERAERRARRSAGEEELQPREGEEAAGEGERDGDAGDASFMSVDPEGVPLRHRRGPGDEEDYETPPRPERPAKRARFEGVEENQDTAQEKRVKWDKGLHTTVYLDDTPPKPRRNKQAVPAQKSCLTPAAKALRLDTLGNVLNAELPVGGLVRESIVVKKFVFEDDEVAQPEVASPAPVKSTRSKSKKAKS